MRLTLRIDQAICYCTGSATITTPNEQTGRLMDRLRARQPTREHFDALERWTEARCGHSRDPQNAAQHDTGEERRRAHSRLDMADEGSRHIKRQSGNIKGVEKEKAKEDAIPVCGEHPRFYLTELDTTSQLRATCAPSSTSS